MSGMDSGNRKMDLRQESKPSSAVELELQALFEELSTATSVVNTIKSRINLIAPVSHLPPELLARIFLILRDIQSISIMPRERNPDCPIFKYLGWIVVTQVCSRWRRAAIDCPALWTTVTFDRGSRWADQMLLRSKQAPVEISICQNGCDWDRKAMIHDAKRIADHIPHTSLDISLTKAGSVLDNFSPELLRPAPILRKLSLAYVCGLQEDRGDVYIAPAELFANDTPCLREVSLHNVFIPWSSSLFKGLRSLQIWLPSGLRSPPQAGQYAHFVPTLIEFIDALDNIPALQALDVTGALPSFSAANVPLFTMDRKVSLPQLRNLLFGGAILDVALTLSLLAVPSEFNFGLCCTSCDDPIHTMNLFRIVSSHLGTDPIVAYGLSLTASGFEIWDNKSNLYFVFEFDPFINGGDTMQQFFAALPQIEVSNIEVLNISLNSSAWQRALKKPNVAAVHTLIFERSLDPLNDVYTLLRPFAGIIADSAAAEGPVLPSLRTLKFIELDAQQMLPVQRSACLEALESRRTLGLPLEAVVFGQCSPLDGEWVDELKRIVPMVIVDESTDNE